MSKKNVDNKIRVFNKPVKIMVFGTFDGVHKGHINFFKQARALKTLVPRQAKNLAKNSFLIVSIARDKNVIKIKKVKPEFSEKERLNIVKKSKGVDKVVLSGIKNHLPHILKEKPDIIALGYDQKKYIKNLKEDLKNKGLLVKIIRLKPFKEHIYKNRFLKNK